MAVVGAEQGWVFIRHEYGPEEHVAARRAGRAARGRRDRAGRVRQRAAAGRRGVRLARRLHPRRGDRAAGVHGGPPRRAAQQAPVPRQLRPARPADADQLGGDLRRRAGDRAARRAVVGGPGRRRLGGLEVLRRVRARRAARRLLRADGHHRPRADRAGRRGQRRPGGRGGAAGRGVVELHRAGQAGHAAGLRHRGGERHDARLGGRWSCWPRAPTCSPRRPTCCGSSATSRAASACRAGWARPRRTTILRDVVESGSRAGRRPARARPAAGGGHAQDLHLRAGPGRAGPGGERARAEQGRRRRPRAAPPATGRRTSRTGEPGVLHRPHGRRGAGRVPPGPAHRRRGRRAGRGAAPGAGRRRARAGGDARVRPLDRGRLRGARRRHLRRLRGPALLPRPGRSGAHGRRAHGRRVARQGAWRSRPARCCRTGRTPW